MVNLVMWSHFGGKRKSYEKCQRQFLGVYLGVVDDVTGIDLNEKLIINHVQWAWMVLPVSITLTGALLQ